MADRRPTLALELRRLLADVAGLAPTADGRGVVAWWGGTTW